LSGGKLDGLVSDDVLDPVLGRLTLAPRFGWHESEPRHVSFLRGQRCRFVIEDYDTDEAHRGEIQRAVQNALDAGPEILNDAERYVVQYCQEMLVRYPKEHRPDVRVEKASDVWAYVTFGGDIHVNRRADGEGVDAILSGPVTPPRGSSREAV
jgi:hypothetical protein